MSSTNEPFNLNWGILSCGRISTVFVKDILLDPATRNAKDIKHTITAVATSNSQSRAQQFLKDCNVPSSAKAYDSYKALVEDSDVDIIYIGTPHSHHYQHARLALEAGKHVLCEKAFTVNVDQTKELCRIAKEKNLFLMEAVWTRYFPIVKEIMGIIKEGKIGKVHRVMADLSCQLDLANIDLQDRMVNVDLAGGALLDLGIYSITWVFMVLYHLLPEEERQKPAVVSAITQFAKTGADESASVIMAFPPHNTHGIATTSLRVDWNPDDNHGAGPAIRISGSGGEIQVFGPAFRPQRYRVIPASHNKKIEFSDVTREIPGHGMHWEADEAARCIRDGKLQSEGIDWQESIIIMEVMDKVRKSGGVTYPDKIESLEYPLPDF